MLRSRDQRLNLYVGHYFGQVRSKRVAKLGSIALEYSPADGSEGHHHDATVVILSFAAHQPAVFQPLHQQCRRRLCQTFNIGEFGDSAWTKR